MLVTYIINARLSTIFTHKSHRRTSEWKIIPVEEQEDKTNKKHENLQSVAAHVDHTCDRDYEMRK